MLDKTLVNINKGHLSKSA